MNESRMKDYLCDRLHVLDDHINDDVSRHDRVSLKADCGRHDEIWRLLAAYYPDEAAAYYNDRETRGAMQRVQAFKKSVGME